MSNLPPPPFKGVIEDLVNIDIDAPIERVWSVLTDLHSYPSWNPYLRSAVMVDPTSHQPSPDPALRPGTLEVGLKMPPAMTTKKPSVVYEKVSLVDHTAHRITWGGGRMPSLFRAELAQALSTTADGKTRYETRHLVGGVSGYIMKLLMGAMMSDCMQAMVDAVKERAEG